jgi:hypothetical protein
MSVTCYCAHEGHHDVMLYRTLFVSSFDVAQPSLLMCWVSCCCFPATPFSWVLASSPMVFYFFFLAGLPPSPCFYDWLSPFTVYRHLPLRLYRRSCFDLMGGPGPCLCSTILQLPMFLPATPPPWLSHWDAATSMLPFIHGVMFMTQGVTLACLHAHS